MLDGVRVVDATTEIAGPYCTKILADAGADVVKVEPPGGDPLRRWRSGGLFEFLNASKRSVLDDADELAATADVYVSEGPVDLDARWAANPALVVVTVTPFGCSGPWVGRPATEFTLQAACGSTGQRGLPEQPPLAAGGRIGEWVTGTYAALGALAAYKEALRSGHGEHVDVAMLDAMAVTMVTYPSVFASFTGWPRHPGTGRTVEVPSVEPTADGFVGVTTNSAQQFSDFLVMIGRPDLLEDHELARATRRFARRDEFWAAVRPYTTVRTTAEVLQAASDFRIPAAPVLDGSTVPHFEQFEARGVFGPSPSGRFPQPRVPFAVSGTSPRPFGPAPELGQHTGTVDWPTRPARPATEWALPLAGVRVLDCTAWWAGPVAGAALAALGADVVKVESTARPDPMRFSSTRRPAEDLWWEWCPIFHGANAGKRGVTLDLTTPDGVALFERLAARADLVIENFTPRVMEQFGLGWERLHQVNPNLVMVRMPAFGLSGPWRDRTGFAQTMECLTGMAWLTGFPEGPPTLVRGACDPLAGMQSVIGGILALMERDRVGGGRLVESTMVESALNVAAEQVIEYGASGVVLRRDGNRGPGAAPQGVYPCAGDDAWVAVAVTTDRAWRALCAVTGRADWADDSELADEPGRRRHHDRIDEGLARWTADRAAKTAAERLARAGVAAAAVTPPRDQAAHPQLRARGLFEVEHHPVTGDHELPGLPFRFSRVPRWLRAPAPTLGQHNGEVLAEIGLTPTEVADLRTRGAVGERPAG
jgi:crotonobetainyl-CoA:carnitine CoA-transferase CaiB-like acyl-CoA transferase